MYNNKMYLYGGSQGLNSNGQLYSLDLNSNLWEPIRTKAYQGFDENMAPECDEHTAVVYEDHMYIFGGFVNGDRTNDVYKFNFKASEWQGVATGEPKPCPRAGHSSVVVEGANPYMYIFGGKDNDDKMLNDMWRLSLSTHAWEQIKYDATTAPRGRQGHSMAVYRGQVIVFGGLYEITRELNDFFIFNIEKNEWKRLFRTTNEDDAAAMQKSDTLKSKKTRRDDSPDATGGSHSKSLSRKATVKVETKKPKAIKSPRQTEEPVNLESPTSVTMKQSFLLKQADKEFEGYFNVVKKKKDGQPACA
jgi:N-acetylneuraminic acid mutarotase